MGEVDFLKPIDKCILSDMNVLTLQVPWMSALTFDECVDFR